MATLAHGALAECYCGERVPRGDGKADRCNKRCTGNRKEICGGHNRINIYEFGGGYDNASSEKDEHSSLKDDAVEGAQALGCYEDSKNKRVLDEHSFDDKTGMTAQARGLRKELSRYCYVY